MPFGYKIWPVVKVPECQSSKMPDIMTECNMTVHYYRMKHHVEDQLSGGISATEVAD